MRDSRQESSSSEEETERISKKKISKLLLRFVFLFNLKFMLNHQTSTSKVRTEQIQLNVFESFRLSSFVTLTLIFKKRNLHEFHWSIHWTNRNETSSTSFRCDTSASMCYLFNDIMCFSLLFFQNEFLIESNKYQTSFVFSLSRMIWCRRMTKNVFHHHLVRQLSIYLKKFFWEFSNFFYLMSKTMTIQKQFLSIFQCFVWLCQWLFIDSTCLSTMVTSFSCCSSMASRSIL